MRLIVHNERVFSVEDFLGAGECEALIELAEARGYSARAARASAGVLSQ